MFVHFAVPKNMREARLVLDNFNRYPMITFFSSTRLICSRPWNAIVHAALYAITQRGCGSVLEAKPLAISLSHWNVGIGLDHDESTEKWALV